MACYGLDKREHHLYGMTAIPLTGAILVFAVSTQASVSHHP